MSNNNSYIAKSIPEASAELIEKFEKFFELLKQYNSKINLVSRASMDHAHDKHFADCFIAMEKLRSIFSKHQTIYDFGAGNGFPGIIAALMFPTHEFNLVERDVRKAEFIKLAASRLELDNLNVLAVDVAQIKDDSCPLVISRAMAPLPKFLLASRSVVPKGGEIYLLKGDHWSSEMGAVPAQLFEFWEVGLFVSYDLPNNSGSRHIIRCKRL